MSNFICNIGKVSVRMRHIQVLVASQDQVGYALELSCLHQTLLLPQREAAATSALQMLSQPASAGSGESLRADHLSFDFCKQGMMACAPPMHIPAQVNLLSTPHPVSMVS